MTHHLESIAGFAGAGASTAALWLAQVAPPELAPWVQLGGTVSLIGCLVFAVRSLKADNTALTQSLAEEKAARLKDAKDANEQYRKDMVAADSSRLAMLTELKTQTRVMQDK